MSKNLGPCTRQHFAAACADGPPTPLDLDQVAMFAALEGNYDFALQIARGLVSWALSLGDSGAYKFYEWMGFRTAMQSVVNGLDNRKRQRRNARAKGG